MSYSPLTQQPFSRHAPAAPGFEAIFPWPSHEAEYWRLRMAMISVAFVDDFFRTGALPPAIARAHLKAIAGRV